MPSSSVAGSLSDLLPILVLFGPTTVVLLACRYLNRREGRRPTVDAEATNLRAARQ